MPAHPDGIRKNRGKVHVQPGNHPGRLWRVFFQQLMKGCQGISARRIAEGEMITEHQPVDGLTGFRLLGRQPRAHADKSGLVNGVGHRHAMFGRKFQALTDMGGCICV